MKKNRPDSSRSPNPGAITGPTALEQRGSTAPEAAPSTDLSHHDFPIVGLGASAGGLEALKAFFSEVPEESGIAYIVVVHLTKKHPSMLPELLQNTARIPVSAAQDNETVQPDHVYVIPPDKEITVFKDRLQLADILETEHHPIDTFLRSLSEDRGKNAAAVILSGTGTDGTLGIREIQSRDGLVVVQSEASAGYDGMPRSAINTGFAEMVLPPPEMPQKIIEWFSRTSAGRGIVVSEDAEVTREEENWLNKIFALLRSRVGHDFTAYKAKTLNRRINRRMGLHRIESHESYLRFLRENPSEIDTLFRELLIGVTSFFRDPESFESLKTHGLPDLFERIGDDAIFRAWVPGCSTGEEVFSLAITLREYLQTYPKRIDLQLFGTDIDEEAIDKARSGLYPASIAADMSEDRLKRFFIREGNHFRACKEIRECVVFSVQDVLQDPPFSRLNLVCCRNLLIYFETDAQKRLLPLFHYTLNPGGMLMLGGSETVGGFTNLFGVVDKKWKIFKRLEVPPPLRRQLEFPSAFSKTAKSSNGVSPTSLSRKEGIGKFARQAMLDQFAPPAVLVESDGALLYVQGHVGSFLEQPGGPPTQNIVDLARDGLRVELSKALRTATTTGNPVLRRGISVKTEDGSKTINLHVRKQIEPKELSGRFLVVFEEVEGKPHARRARAARRAETEPGRLAVLEQELKLNRETHQATVEELESANEELKSTNEELQSSNEELQSTSEEMESSKEELQSVNEELQTVNAELQSKLDELSTVRDDVRNLLESTEIATIFVDTDLRVRMFTPDVTAVVNLIPSDTGRPLEHVMTNLLYDGIIADLKEVLRTLIPRQVEVQTKAEVWYSMRIMPYRTTDNRIDGAVLTFSSIDEQKKTQEALRFSLREADASRKLVRNVFDMSPDPVLVIDGAGEALIFNTAFAGLLRITEEGAAGRDLLNDLICLPDRETLGSRLKSVVENDVDLITESVELDLPAGLRRYTVTCRVIGKDDESPYHVLVSFAEEKQKEL